MTAEIAVMNKLGVALAADSAVTISGSNSIKKTYNIFLTIILYNFNNRGGLLK